MDHRTFALWACVDAHGGLDLKDFLAPCRLQLILRKVFGLTLEFRCQKVAKKLGKFDFFPELEQLLVQ
jgi:hypothetical protein